MRPPACLSATRLDLLGDPGVVGLDQAELAELVVAVRVEAGRDEDHLRREAVEPAHPVLLDQGAHRRPARVRRHRHVDHVVAQRHGAAVRIERMLEDARHQDALVAGDDVLGAVAVMDVEVDDRDPLEAAHVERMARRDGDVVEEAEAHRLLARRVVAGRAHGAEGVVDLAVDDRVGGGDGGAGGAQHRVQGAGRSDRVGVERAQLAVGGDALEHVAQLGDVAAAVGVAEVGALDHRCLAAIERAAQPGGDQVVVDRVEARRAFGMAAAHVVAAAVGMCCKRPWSSVFEREVFLVMSGR